MREKASHLATLLPMTPGLKPWLVAACRRAGGKDSAPLLGVLASPLPRLASPRLYSRRDCRWL